MRTYARILRTCAHVPCGVASAYIPLALIAFLRPGAGGVVERRKPKPSARVARVYRIVSRHMQPVRAVTVIQMRCAPQGSSALPDRERAEDDLPDRERAEENPSALGS